jgi:hypothetical protein
MGTKRILCDKYETSTERNQAMVHNIRVSDAWYGLRHTGTISSERRCGWIATSRANND